LFVLINNFSLWINTTSKQVFLHIVIHISRIFPSLKWVICLSFFNSDPNFFTWMSDRNQPFQKKLLLGFWIFLMFILWKESLNSDGKKNPPISTKRTTTFHLKSLIIIKTTTYDFGNPGPVKLNFYKKN
jgi:hypothetical protein